MKVGDLIRLPQGQGYTIAVKIVSHDQDPRMPTGDIAVLVMQEHGLDWWDANYCQVIQ